MDVPATKENHVFSRHTDSVLCCSIDDKTRIAVSGGIDDTAYVWDINTKHVIFECSGHKESVVTVAFSLNSTYVATGDLNGHIQVRNTITGIKIFEFDIDEINWMLWHNTSEFVLLAGTTGGDFWMWNVNDPAAVRTFPSFGFPTTAAKLLPDGLKIATSYADGSLRVFDLKTKQAILQLNDPNNSEITYIDINPHKALVAVGSVNSTVRLILLNGGKLIGTLNCVTPESEKQKNIGGSTSERPPNEPPIPEASSSTPTDMKSADHDESDEPPSSDPIEVIDEYSAADPHDKDADEEYVDDDDEDDDPEEECEAGDTTVVESVESVLFSPCGNYLVAANNLGSIFNWDVSTQALRCELHTGVGISRCTWSDRGSLIAGCLDGSVRIYDINLNLLRAIPGHADQILDVAYKHGVLVTASEDKTCRTTKLIE